MFVPSYKITHFIFSLYCVVVQHNNKLRTIENKQERRMVLVLDAKMPSSAPIYYREISEAELVETYP